MEARQGLWNLARVQADLGESPVWDERSATLYFVDISAGRIHRLGPEGRLSTLYQCQARIGALALTEAGNLIFTRDAEVAILQLPSARVSRVSEAASRQAGYRFNDGACDPQGRFVTGLMDQQHQPGSGRLLVYEADLSARVLLPSLDLPNGVLWSADGRQVFFVDSVARTLYRAGYSAALGCLEQVSVFARTPPLMGRPDGLALDADGGIWVCQFNGACLLRYDRLGRLTRVLPVPVPRPTSCCFSGPDLRTLVITTARFGLSAEQLAAFPESGDLYAIRLAVPGVARQRFREG